MEKKPPKTMMLGTTGGWKKEYRLAHPHERMGGLTRSRALFLAKAIRRGGRNAKVKKIGDEYFVYIRSPPKRRK